MIISLNFFMSSILFNSFFDDSVRICFIVVVAFELFTCGLSGLFDGYSFPALAVMPLYVPYNGIYGAVMR